MDGPYDIDRIAIIITDIERYLGDLEELGIKNTGDLEEKKTYYAASMILFSLLNRVIDLGNEMVMAKGLGIPSAYRDIFSLIRKDGMIDREAEKSFSSLVYYRNLLSHEYHGIQPGDIIRIRELLGTVTAFVATVKDQIRNGNRTG